MAVVEGWLLEKLEEVAVVEGWPLREVPLNFVRYPDFRG